MLILKPGCDTYALSRCNDDMKTLVDALRETLAVLRATDHGIVLRSTTIVEILPQCVVRGFFRKLMSSRYGEIGAGWHCSQAPDEMFQLARELKVFVEQSSEPVPVLRQLLATA